MIHQQDNKNIFNEQVSFDFPRKMRIDPHPDTCPSENELHLISKSGQVKLVISFVTVDKSARDFTEEIYEERKDMTVVEQLCGIETASGIKGWSTRVEYGNEVVEEITLDLPGEPHSLLNLHFWKLKQPNENIPFGWEIHEILKSVRMVGNDSSQSTKKAPEQAVMGANKRKRGRKPDPIAYTKTHYYPNAIVHVRFPDISDEENERRMKLIKQSAAELVKEKIKADRERERKACEAQEKQQE